jgi:hypothetical protein
MTARTEAEQEAGLDERMAAVREAEEIFGTDSPEHLAAIDDWTEFACGWSGPSPEPELEAEL